ncbi:DUF7146 domain-containing protein [Piscinibacter koreensis]|uniref:Toprim domain-containing protein n=1 Tax=Piscinibacter koreensis TaxID=2742824 RepID=A0A7Y6NP28_9BURK|nr:toprim domain-containing protein [Schlegelella koreensis]NUZ06747.1 toprim domain-containing protein [Schlegelella koreensis]
MDDFRNAIHAALGAAPDDIEPGRLHRFATSGKRSDQSGWCRLFEDERAGVFGCFRLGVSEVWTSTPRERMTPAERAALQRRIPADRATREREQQAQWRRNADRIAYLWRQSRPIVEGDAAHRYLCARLAASAFDAPTCLRLHVAMPYVHDGETVGTWPALVAPLVGRDGRTLALHRTYIDLNGRKADVPGPVKKLTPAAGLLKGASIPLHAPKNGAIGAAEGIETALAAACGSGVPTVAAYSAGALASYVWPSTVRKLYVFADHDPAGAAGARELEQRAIGSGIFVKVLAPDEPGTDWCDAWATRAAEVCQ